MKKFLSGIIIGILLLGIPIVVHNNTPKNYIELKHNYKNCVVIRKGELFNREFLIVENPITKSKNRIYVKAHVFFNINVGDTIN